MTVQELDLNDYQNADLEMLYRMLAPLIAEDFMSRDDCEAVHRDGNMIAGESTVTHTNARGGQAIYIENTLSQYREEVRDGIATLERARETGEFRG